MNLARAVLYGLDIPFNISFRHSSACRKTTASVLVELQSSTGLIGFGEACPRSYVTAESIDSVHQFFANHMPSIRQQVCDLESLRHWQKCHSAEIDRNPAAMCAIELALLDLLAKMNQQTVESLLGLSRVQEVFHYSAVLGDSDSDSFQATLKRYLQMGFIDYKVKLSGILDRDLQKCRVLKQYRENIKRLRFDANNLWPDASTAIQYLEKLETDYFAIEEPLAANRYSELTEIIEQTGCKVILDESFLREQQFRYLRSHREQWIINLRVSKMGGILRSLNIVNLAQELGIQLIIGAHVGETSILTRAALTVASQASQLIIAQEGAYGDLLLSEDICKPVLRFGFGGQLHTEKIALGQLGWGLNIINCERMIVLNEMAFQ